MKAFRIYHDSRICQKKITYATQIEAHYAMQKITQRRRNIEAMRVYRCKGCGFYHLTHRDLEARKIFLWKTQEQRRKRKKHKVPSYQFTEENEEHP